MCCVVAGAYEISLSARRIAELNLYTSMATNRATKVRRTFVCALVCKADITRLFISASHREQARMRMRGSFVFSRGDFIKVEAKRPVHGPGICFI